MKNDYVTRLECCGIAAHNALRLICDFEKEFSGEDLETFIESIEKDAYVDKIQC